MTGRLTTTADQLRRSFDASFAQADPAAAADLEDLIAIRVGACPFVMRVRDLRELAPLRALVAIPARAPALLGVVGLRGQVVPVFGLAPLLGQAHTSARWLVVGRDRTDDPLALGFEALRGYRRVARAAFTLDPDPAAARQHVREAVLLDGELHGVIDVARLLATLRAHPAAPATGADRLTEGR